MKYYLSMLLTLCCLLSPSANASQTCDAECQLPQIHAYFKALDKVSQSGSSEQDVDDFLGLLHPNVNYIHLEYGANFDRASWRSAFIRNIARGAYQQPKEQRVLNYIVGKNHVAVEYAHGSIQPDGQWQQELPLLVLFGFTDGKISLVKELW
ncbi:MULTISPECIES: nuclear transport factor 2 family protein [Shewanella]|uniref:nuclear transport factor 2 family protein n=1 Tax=Shewanella TaxID=22 RepID=UPI00201A66E2|nr:nuclear transport factor 2 family protein [Shewanella sp. 10B]